ncbi:MAG: restriction endonuclease subunit S [Nitrosomonas sp.]|uniref:restriction endonuclease subunit S n=1 Tax=Nitrosomonas sp. TaxID=42353 RepID=UPI0032EE0607
MSWPALEIGQLVNKGDADIQTGPFGTQLKASDYVEHGVPVINVRNIGYSDLRPEKIEYIMESKSEQLGVHKLENNDIVFGRKGAVDRHLYVKNEQVGWIQGSDCIRLRFSSEEINPRFVSYLFLSSYHKQWMLNQCGNKATMASLNQDVVKRISIKLPSKTHQDIIVEVLQKYDDLIENNKRRIELLEESVRQLYKEWFVRLRFPGHEHVKIIDGVPEGWQKKPFSSVADFLNGFAFKPSHFEEDGLPIVKIPELKDGVSEKTPRNSGVDVPTSLHLEDGDLLFSWSGTLAVNVWASGPALLNQHLFKVVSTAELSRSFLLVALREAMPQFMNETTGATMKHIRRAALDKVQVIFPREHLLSEFEDFVTNCYEQVIYLYKQNISLTQARDILLPKLMSGEIAV